MYMLDRVDARNHARDDLRAAILAHPGFAQLGPAALEPLIAASRLVTFTPGERMFDAGEGAAAVYLVSSGVVRVFHREGAVQITVRHVVSPATVGEKEVMSGEQYVDNAEALTHCLAVRIDAPVFVSFLQEHPKVAWVMLRAVCARSCVAARNERVLLESVNARLASLLLAYRDLFGQTLDAGVVIRHRLSLDDLALGLGATRRSVARALAGWRDSRVLDRYKGWIRILDVEALEQAARALRDNLNYHEPATVC